MRPKIFHENGWFGKLCVIDSEIFSALFKLPVLKILINSFICSIFGSLVTFKSVFIFLKQSHLSNQKDD